MRPAKAAPVYAFTLAGIDSCVPAPLQSSLSALRTGANLLAGALKLGSEVLGGLARVVEEVVEQLAHADSSELRDTPAEDAIATPVGFVGAREGAPVAPEGFLAGTERERTGPGVEDVVPAPRAPGGPARERSSAPPRRPAVDETPTEREQSSPAQESEWNGRKKPETSAPPEPQSAASEAPAAPAQASGDLEPAPDGPAPTHVDEEAVLVAEFADPGAEDGAGAQIHIDEPWHGYKLLKAPEIIDRLLAEPDDVLVLVLLYERAHRERKTVIAAAERELAGRAA